MARPPSDDGVRSSLSQLLAQADGDELFLRELVSAFLHDAPKRLADIRDALARGDLEAAGHAAHTLVGSIGNFSAGGAHAAARRVEDLARCGSPEAAAEALAQAEDEIAELTAQLERVCEAL